MGRIDIHLEVPSVPYKDFSAATDGASSAEIFQRVMKAGDVQSTRLAQTKIFSNARMNSRHIRQFCKIVCSKESLSGRVLGLPEASEKKKPGVF